MILRGERLDGSKVVSAWEHPRLAGWADPRTASIALRKGAKWLNPEPLICGGYETRLPHPSTGLRERITFWPDRSA